MVMTTACDTTGLVVPALEYIASETRRRGASQLSGASCARRDVGDKPRADLLTSLSLTPVPPIATRGRRLGGSNRSWHV